MGGVVHHVHMAAGGRVSYGPYRDVSKQLVARLRRFAGVGVIEKASIDEAYIQRMSEAQYSDPAPMTVMQQAAQLAETIRRTGTHKDLSSQFCMASLDIQLGRLHNSKLPKLCDILSWSYLVNYSAAADTHTDVLLHQPQVVATTGSCCNSHIDSHARLDTTTWQTDCACESYLYASQQPPMFCAT